MSRATLVGTVLALLVLLAARAAPAQALEVQTQDVVIVPAGTTTGDDLLAAGQTVTIAGRVTGETYAFGRSVTVTGTIERDLITAAQQVTIDGTVHGDLRVAAQQVVINGRVEGNVTSFAQTVTLAQQGTVGGSVLGAAQDVTLLGSVGRGVAVGAGSLYLGSSVGENVQARVENLVVGPDARIAGRLEYTSATQAAVPAGAVAGGVRYQPEPPREQRRQEERPFAGLFGFFSLVWLAGSLLAGILLVHFAPGFAASAAAWVQEQPFSTLGLGALTLLVVPPAALLVAITLVGLPLAFVAGLSYLLGLYIGWLVLGLALGTLLADLVRRRPAGRAVDARWLVVLGLLVLYVLSHLPWVGGLATFVGLCFGLGALVRQVLAAWPRPAAPAPAL